MGRLWKVVAALLLASGLSAAVVPCAGAEPEAEARSEAIALLEETFGKGAFEAGVISVGEPRAGVPRNALILHTDPYCGGYTLRANCHLALLSKSGSSASCLVLTTPHIRCEGCPVACDP
ncbi:MAG: hypothetical protein ACYTAN_03350, partial [Planctomycetota bacterium]